MTARGELLQLLTERVREDSEWLRVLYQFQKGCRAFPEPFQDRRPSDRPPSVEP